MTIQSLDTDTIAALATPPGRGGVGIIRVSGPNAKSIAARICNRVLEPRYAYYGGFFETIKNELNEKKSALDKGIALFFEAPNSFTGEDILELQGHGGPILLDCLLKEVMKQGARLARPGEFSERAFLNNKIDLTQAEAIADLIDSASEQAAKNALRSLQGEFSQKINTVVEQVIKLRIYVEAAIDFPEEEIDFLADGKVANDLNAVIAQLDKVFAEAKQGALIQEGMTVVIAGKPNAGKSSLLNALSGRDSAIVTAIEGTTRDIVREQIQIDGMPLHIIDTAGLRESPDIVEQEGIRRAWDEIKKANRILLVVDSTYTQESDPYELWPEAAREFVNLSHITVIHNKSDLDSTVDWAKKPMDSEPSHGSSLIKLSAKNGEGIDKLRQHLKSCMGYSEAGEGGFTARRRHIDALEKAKQALKTGQKQLINSGAGELLAEDLRLCQRSLGEITGEFNADDLLGEIFSSFCIGK